MQHLDIIIILMAVLAVLYSVADWIKVSYPILLVVAGLAIGCIPGLPTVKLQPDVVFLIFLPPLLFEAARNTSWHDFRNNRGAIGRLAIGLVFFTTVAVAICAHYMIPGFNWPLSFILGAIVSPPDVAAATSAIKGLRLPKRIVTILEGESLVNDASALIAYRYALACIFTGTFVLWHAAIQFFIVAGGGIAIGLVIGFAFMYLQKKILDNPTVETCLALVVPFMSYVGAEHLGVSGVLAVVSAGLVVSWKSHEMFSFQTRMRMNNFWETLIFLLNGLVFILIGLQLPAILSAVEDYTLDQLVVYGLIISAVTIIVRIIWIYPTVYISATLRRLHDKDGAPDLNARLVKELLVIGWAGMRGVVSLASALALPLMLPNGNAFPERNVVLFITFIVILVTLVLQGLTLPFLVRYLGVQEPLNKGNAEEKTLRLQIAHSSMKFIDDDLSNKIQNRLLDQFKEKFERQINYLNEIIGNPDLARQTEESDHSRRETFYEYIQSELAIVDHQRKLLVQMHKDGSFSAEALRRIEQELDIWAMSLSEKLKALKNMT